MVSEQVNVKNEIIKENLYYNKSLVLSYKIEYPQFESVRFRAAANKMNRYYRQKAMAYEKYLKQNLYQQAVQEYKNSVENGYPVRAFEAVTAYKITYNLNCTLSLYFDRYEYTGGAHGSTLRYSDTWNLQAGYRIMLSQLFSRRVNARSYVIKSINKQIEAQIKRGNNIYFEDYEKNVEKYFNPKSFYLTQTGIVIYFQQYEIAPYAAGIVEFIIPYEKGVVIQPSCR